MLQSRRNEFHELSVHLCGACHVHLPPIRIGLRRHRRKLRHELCRIGRENSRSCRLLVGCCLRCCCHFQYLHSLDLPRASERTRSAPRTFDLDQQQVPLPRDFDGLRAHTALQGKAPLRRHSSATSSGANAALRRCVRSVRASRKGPICYVALTCPAPLRGPS